MAGARLAIRMRQAATTVVALAVAGLVGYAVTQIAGRFGVYDLTRDAGFTDHSLPPPDPRSEQELESLRRFPPGATRLQPLIDATPQGGVLTLKAGLYAAPGVIDRTIRIEAERGAIVDGGGVGSIVTVNADDVSISGLTLRNSGERHETTDAAIRLRGRHGSFKDNVIEDSLFGFELRQSDRNIIRRNRIASKALPEALRGDAIRVWYSAGNIIEDNDIERTRDLVVWYARDNRIAGNRIRDSRYGVHLMYAHGNAIEKNHFLSNTVGVFLMYANDSKIVDNVITYSQGPSGIGIGFKESSNTIVAHNDIFANARGVFMDASPYDPEGFNRFENNRIAYNGVAVAFHSDWEGNAFARNAFIGNHRAVTVAGARSAKRNRWDGNYWDDYEGFDRNRDGLGDTPYESWSWADRLWMDVPDAQFFRAAPSLEAIDFIERLGAFHEPQLILRDSAPLFAPPPGVGVRRPEKSS